MVIAETLMGVQLVRSAIKGIKDVINTCEDVSEIAHHIDNVFQGEEQVNRKSDDEGDGTSIQEIAQELIEKKQIEQQRTALAHLLNRRFGADTWSSIMKIRFERIEKLKEKRKAALQRAKEEAWERKRFWKKTGEESGKLLIVLGVIVGMYYYISYACKGCI